MVLRSNKHAYNDAKGYNANENTHNPTKHCEYTKIVRRHFTHFA